MLNLMKIYIETYGCSANYNNGEIIAGLLKKAGHKLVSEKQAQLIILNTCIVKAQTENKIIHRMKQIKKSLVVTGCMPNVEAELIKQIQPSASLVGVNHIKDIVKAVGRHQELISKQKEIKLCLPKIRKNKIINIVQILEGCKGNCAYCIVKLVKGDLHVYPEKEILKEIKQSIKQGCKEIWLTSQDSAAYPDLPRLLDKITKINGDFIVRLGMSNPNNVLPMLSELIHSFSSEKIFKFLHIPVQSGNNTILKSMNRYYKINDFKKIVKVFRKEFPEITIATDIICGFPGETEKQFNDTLKLIKDIKIGVINISRFGARPGTKAKEMKQLPGEIINERSKKLTKLFLESAKKENQRWIGWAGNILIDEKGKNDAWIGRNFAYKPVIVKGNYHLGQKINVTIKSATAHDLRS